MSTCHRPTRCLLNYIPPSYPSPVSHCSQTRHIPHLRDTRHHRTFTTTRSWLASIVNPYEVLGVSHDCPQSDIKKQFYTLSKAHHPDHNPNNQEEAAKKFVAISDAYHLIGNPKSRETWDRENYRRPDVGREDGAPSGSGFGARKASGLSRRRTQFRGPPASFYRNGGYGAAANARQSHMGRDAAAEAFKQQQEAQAQASAPGGGYAGETGSWPFTTDPNDVPHFDREGHFRTTKSVEDQLTQGRKKRRKAWDDQRQEEYESGQETVADVIGKFILYGGTLAVGLGVSSWMVAAHNR